MTSHAILLGSAPKDFRQKKIEDMSDFLISKNGGRGVVTFANGITELMLEMVMGNSVKQLANVVVSSASTTTKDNSMAGKNATVVEPVETTTQKPAKIDIEKFCKVKMQVINHTAQIAGVALTADGKPLTTEKADNCEIC